MYFRVVKWNPVLKQWDGTRWGVPSSYRGDGFAYSDDDAHPLEFGWVRLTLERAKAGLRKARHDYRNKVYRLQRYDDGEPDPLCNTGS